MLQFFEKIEKYRQTSLYQIFQFRQEIKTFDDNSTSNDTSIILKHKTIAFQITVSRIKSRFRYENDIFVIRRNQVHVKISRVSSYSFIIDSNNRFIIDNQQINNNQFIIINSINTRETSVEKIIYEQFIKFNSIIVFMNSVFQVVITIVVSIVVIQIIESIKAEIRQKMQQINQRNQRNQLNHSIHLIHLKMTIMTMIIINFNQSILIFSIRFMTTNL